MSLKECVTFFSFITISEATSSARYFYQNMHIFWEEPLNKQKIVDSFHQYRAGETLSVQKFRIYAQR